MKIVSKESAWEYAQAFVAKWEGGLIDHPSDPGGITNHGVSLRFLKETRPDAGPEDIKSLSKEDAAAILKKNFWDPLGLDALPAPLALAVYDAAVNMGRARGVRLLQQAIVSLGGDVAIDGVMGPETLAAIRASPPASLANEVLAKRRFSYVALAETNPKMAVFLKGWLARVDALARAVLDAP